MEAALYSLEPDTAGYILELYLEGELEQGLRFIGQLTTSLTDETNSIMDEVSDIIGLPHLDDSGVQEGVIHSKRKRDDTVTQLYEFDANQTTALNPIEMDIQTMDQWLSDIEGLTDVNFHQNEWAALTSQSRLKVELDARQASLKKLSHELNWEKLQSIYQKLLDYAKPITFGFGGTISKQSPFVASDMIALSCTVPEADDNQQEKVNQNPFVKSFNSFKEMGRDFWTGLEMRAEKSLDSPYHFVNYMTLGATDGILSGAKERADKMFESKTDFANYATFGFSGMIKETVLPEDSFSKEHWQSSFGAVTSLFGFGKLITSPTKTVKAPDGSKVKNVTEIKNKTDNYFSNYEYNMIENPGPLAELDSNPASNFASGKYNIESLAEDSIFYRAGTNDNPFGQWFTKEAPDSVAQVRIDSAVKSQWINPKTGVLEGTSPLEAVYEIKIPEGTTLYTGPVGYQGGIYLGGQNNIQTFIQQPWNIDNIEILNKQPLK